MPLGNTIEVDDTGRKLINKVDLFRGRSIKGKREKHKL